MSASQIKHLADIFSHQKNMFQKKNRVSAGFMVFTIQTRGELPSFLTGHGPFRALQARLRRRAVEEQLQRCETELGACLWRRGATSVLVTFFSGGFSGGLLLSLDIVIVISNDMSYNLL